MSRHWSEHTYISAENLWWFIEEHTNRLDILSQSDTVESSELCKLLMLGRREMLDALCQHLHENQTNLGAIVTDGHGILSREELKKLKESDYGS